MFAGISHLDLGVVYYHGKSPEIGGIRYIIYFHLSTGIAAFDFFFFAKAESRWQTHFPWPLYHVASELSASAFPKEHTGPPRHPE